MFKRFSYGGFGSEVSQSANKIAGRKLLTAWRIYLSPLHRGHKHINTEKESKSSADDPQQHVFSLVPNKQRGVHRTKYARRKKGLNKNQKCQREGGHRYTTTK